MSKVMNIFAIFFSIIIAKVLTFNCGINELNYITPHKVPLPKETRKLDNGYKPLRIKMDYTYLESQKKSESLEEGVKRVLSKTVSDIESLLSVQHVNFKYDSSFFTNYCGIKTFGSDYKTWGDEYDLAIIPYFNDSLTQSTIQAAATACIAISETMQPKMGIIMINPNLDFSHTNSEKFLELLFLHELSHVLIFHPSFFTSLNLLGEKIVNKERIYYIKSPKVLEKAKLHFNCDSLEGIPLENYGGQGSAGSHWETRYMLGDYMIATDYPEIVISDITLAVFEDSGFYKVNYYTGGLFRFGKGEGCDFLNQKCVSNGVTSFSNEFCVKSQEPFCTSGHLAKGHCYIAKYNDITLESYNQYFSEENIGGYPPADYCPISFDNLYDKTNYYFVTNCKVGKQNTIHSDYGEKFGRNSICVESSLVPSSSSLGASYRSICYEAKCDKSNKNVILSIGNGEVVCPLEGGMIYQPDGFKGKVMCPDYNSICTSDEWCNEPIDCIEKKIVADESSYKYSYTLQVDNIGNYINGLTLLSYLCLLFYLFH